MHPEATITHWVVLDFEATCDEGEPPDPQEIIEFPSVLLRADTLETVDEFESFVRPSHHPRLTDFCRTLTGIEQADVDAARPFREVLEAHQAWLASHGLPLETDDGALPYAFITCGDWDFQTLFPRQLRATEPAFDYVAQPYRQWVNIKSAYTEWVPDHRSAGMAHILEVLGLTLEGRHHRGIDDCRNIVKIVRALVARGQELTITGRLPTSRYPQLQVILCRGGKQERVTLKRRALKTLLGLASSAFRRQAKHAHLAPSGQPLLDDDDLLDLRDGTQIAIS